MKANKMVQLEKVLVSKLISCAQYPDPCGKALFYNSVLLTLIISKL